MLEINDNTILIKDEDGTEEEWKILFYYVNEERGKTYYLIYKEDDPDSLLVMGTSDGKSLESVSPEEMEEAEETLRAYEEDPNIDAAIND